MKPGSQNSVVLAYLRTRKPLDANIAWRRWGIQRPAARINNLRDLGHKIETQTLWRGQVHWAAYRLVK